MTSECYFLFSDVTVIFGMSFVTDIINILIASAIKEFFLIAVLPTIIGKREPMKIQLQAHHPRSLQQDQKGMPGRFIILLVGNIAAIWATLIMVSVSVWVQAI